MSTILELEMVTKRFGGLTAVDQMSLKVEKGESVGLIGPNGAGKTTLFSLIMGEHRVDSGDIRLREKLINNLPTHQRVQLGISRTYQVPRPFGEMSTEGNISVGLMSNSIISMMTSPFEQEKCFEIASSVGLSEIDFKRLPSELSMGDLRKLELARTLATNPEVMLLDEVFAGLTVGEISQITDLLIEKHKEGLTYLIVSHDLRSLEPLIDRAIAMNRGTFICEGTYTEVMNNSAVQATYLGH